LPDVDVAVLEAHAVYEDVDPNEPHIKYFWDVLRNRFSPQERCDFLQFVWARSRPPASSDGWDMPFKIQPGPRCQTPTDEQLCHSHSCFFSLSLPRYSSADVLEKKLRLSISCKEMDLDVRLTADQVWRQ
ncbi:MAG: hypothetical protein Q8P67_01760, partial [archaeon]|nr:hypothetical protein [archaeon]